MSNTSSDQINQCYECLNSQTSITQTVKSHRRNRRSNSCPGGGFSDKHNDTRENRTTNLTKRWHSISDIKISNINNTYNMYNHHEKVLGSTKEAELFHLKEHWVRFNTKGQISKSLSLSKRVVSLFTLGMMLAVLLNFLQKQNQVTVFPPGVFGDVLNSAWWIPPTFGLASTVIGLLYPKLDQVLGNHGKHQEWSNVMRCIALFVGINHASAKITFDSNTHLSITLALLSLGLWYFFDQSISGLGLGLAITGIATTVTQCLVALDVFGYSNPDFLYMQSWIPCLYFSGGVTIGAVGRALATIDDGAQKFHMD